MEYIPNQIERAAATRAATIVEKTTLVAPTTNQCENPHTPTSTIETLAAIGAITQAI
jgi:hypothetical protein